MFFKQNDIYFSTLSIDRKVSVFLDFPDTNKFVIDSFSHLVQNGKVDIYSFVIMRDHLHIIWRIKEELIVEEIVTSLKKYTGRRIINYLKLNDNEYLNYFMSGRADRNYKVWKIKSENIKLLHPTIFNQKLKYTHLNPTKGDFKTVDKSEEYYYSSARSYLTGSKDFDFLTILIFK